jgi:hypothetical protein
MNMRRLPLAQHEHSKAKLAHDGKSGQMTRSAEPEKHNPRTASAPELALKLNSDSDARNSIVFNHTTPRNEKILGSLPSAASCAPPVHVTCSYSFEPSRNTEDRTTTVTACGLRRLMSCFLDSYGSSHIGNSTRSGSSLTENTQQG